MNLTEEDYKKIESIVIPRVKQIYIDIYKSMNKYIKESGHRGIEKLQRISSNLIFDSNGEIIDVKDIFIIERDTAENLKFFNNQKGIFQEEKYSIKNIPAGHGGRTKGDGKIHLYPYSEKLPDNIEKIINALITEIVIHEIFHYYFMPDLYDENDKSHGDDAWFGHDLTEGIVQYYTEMYMQANNLGASNTGYVAQVLMAEEIIKQLNLQGLNENDILVNCNQSTLLSGYDIDNQYKEGICQNGEVIKDKFIQKKKLINEFKKMLEKYEDNEDMRNLINGFRRQLARREEAKITDYQLELITAMYDNKFSEEDIAIIENAINKIAGVAKSR